MSSYLDRSLFKTKSFSIADITKREIGIAIALSFLLAPVLQPIEVGLVKILFSLRQSSQTRAWIARGPQMILRNPSIRLIRVKLPPTVLRYQRSIAGAQFAPAPVVFNGTVSMLAVSRNAKTVLESNSMSYIDPVGLPEGLKKTLELPFKTAWIDYFLFIPDFSSQILASKSHVVPTW